MVSSSSSFDMPGDASPVDKRTVSIGLLIAVIGLAYLASAYGFRQSALFGVGLGAGVVLYHAAFGFTSAWREFTRDGRGGGLRAQMLMFAVTVIVLLPLIAGGEFLGQALRGSVRPLSVSVIAGAFMFGLGMQLGGGCASGTLFTVGGGSSRMVITLMAFIAGSVLGAWQLPAWQAAPALEPVSLLATLGLPGALTASLALFAAIWAVTVVVERRRHGRVESIGAVGRKHSWLRGPWPLVAGAVGLAGVQLATLILAGRPWGVTSGFALWGSKAAALAGIDVASWPYWQRPGFPQALESSVLADVTSVMNFGIIVGALTAAGLAGKFAPKVRLPGRSVLAAVIGGMLLGYGARIAYGCNIGAYFSGIASTSLHGWLWFVAAFAGSMLGTRLRPWFGLGS